MGVEISDEGSSDLVRPAVDQNRVIATLTRVDGRWLISALKAF